MLALKRARERADLPWPVPNHREMIHALAGLAAADSSVDTLVGLAAQGNSTFSYAGVLATGDGGQRDREDWTVEWLAVSLLSNVATDASSTQLREAAQWFEAISMAMNERAAAAMGTHNSSVALRGWQTSSAWIWMEALEEVVAGTVGYVTTTAL